ncbi:MAG TPA: nickel pincer cofactor biosynthesis protein LarC [Thermoanaerobaculia bacterium]|nr:nickel pincer cofactor biosynthesis protein LarC [Thermoanaerobaculia bacterium]HUM30580.1 nickel pincer cofactor biosynthesis protein LarC [Thermoanaerobaculia bacterium]HXK68772.1 nickel pincer cofactor biosynthesis protein LarC [Thermoanaerobaculia bacterium]
MHLFIDPPAGMAGDMLLAALVDSGADPDAIRHALKPLVEPETIVFQKVTRRGITGTILQPSSAFRSRAVRVLADLNPILQKLHVSDDVRERVRRMFLSILEAESEVHGAGLDEVHLHELASVDTLVDLVGVSAAMETLGVDECTVGPIPFGRGTVMTEHGELPVPAPATVKLLEGFPVFQGTMEGEATTPTAAAILREVAGPGDMPTMSLVQSGYGFGTREGGPLPNCVRVLLGERGSSSTILQLEANMDDMTGQVASLLLRQVLERGALDACLVPLTMKKGRPGLQLVVLLERERLDPVVQTIFRESPTLGVRYFPVERKICDRDMIELDLPEGRISVKVARYRGEIVNIQPEFDQVEDLAAKTGLSVKELFMRVYGAMGDMVKHEDGG